MEWYFKELFRDRRFRIAAWTSLGSLLAIILCAILGAPWAFRVAAYGLFPILMLSIVAVFVVLGLIVRADMLQRKGRR